MPLQGFSNHFLQHLEQNITQDHHFLEEVQTRYFSFRAEFCKPHSHIAMLKTDELIKTKPLRRDVKQWHTQASQSICQAERTQASGEELMCWVLNRHQNGNGTHSRDMYIQVCPYFLLRKISKTIKRIFCNKSFSLSLSLSLSLSIYIYIYIYIRTTYKSWF